MKASDLKYLIAIGGPTASGKTDLSMRLAEHFSCAIISGDSRQFYREMNIGTAKPRSEQLASVRHFLINSQSIYDPYSAGDFERDVMKILSREFKDRQMAILCGGTGLYLRAVLRGLDHFPEVDRRHRDHYQEILDNHGLKPLQDELQRLDPLYAGEVDLHNPHRIIRALSVIRASGRPFSTFLKRSTPSRPFIPICIALEPDRKALYQRINDRVDQMIRNGLVEEARSLFPYRHNDSLNTIGYKEIFLYLDGQYDLATAIDKIKQHSRNYAKRQMTWFRNQDQWKKFNPGDYECIVNHIRKIIQNSHS